MKTHRRRNQRGFLLMAAVFLVVVVGAFIGYLATQSNVQELTSIDDLQSARALQAARAGLEWGAYTIIQTPADGAFTVPCQTATDLAPTIRTLTFAGTSLSDFTTTLKCSASSVTEGGAIVRTYKLVSNACNVPTGGACPNGSTTSSIYVDREVTATISP